MRKTTASTHNQIFQFVKSECFKQHLRSNLRLYWGWFDICLSELECCVTHPQQNLVIASWRRHGILQTTCACYRVSHFFSAAEQPGLVWFVSVPVARTVKNKWRCVKRADQRQQFWRTWWFYCACNSPQFILYLMSSIKCRTLDYRMVWNRLRNVVYIPPAWFKHHDASDSNIERQERVSSIARFS